MIASPLRNTLFDPTRTSSGAGHPAAAARAAAASGGEHIDTGVQPAPWVEQILDPPVERHDRRIDRPRRRRIAVVHDPDPDLHDELAAQGVDRRGGDRPPT